LHFEPEKSNGQFLTELEGKCDKKISQIIEVKSAALIFKVILR
jgi:hypothetical protein